MNVHIDKNSAAYKQFVERREFRKRVPKVNYYDVYDNTRTLLITLDNLADLFRFCHSAKLNPDLDVHVYKLYLAGDHRIPRTELTYYRTFAYRMFVSYKFNGFNPYPYIKWYNTIVSDHGEAASLDYALAILFDACQRKFDMKLVKIKRNNNSRFIPVLQKDDGYWRFENYVDKEYHDKKVYWTSDYKKALKKYVKFFGKTYKSGYNFDYIDADSMTSTNEFGLTVVTSSYTKSDFSRFFQNYYGSSMSKADVVSLLFADFEYSSSTSDKGQPKVNTNSANM